MSAILIWLNVFYIVNNIITVKLFSSSRLGCNIGDKKSLWAKKVRLSILSKNKNNIDSQNQT